VADRSCATPPRPRLGAGGRELVESFRPGVRATDRQRGLNRLRAQFHFRLQAGFTGLFMLPVETAAPRDPVTAAGIAFLLLRRRFIVALEVLRR